VLTDVDRTLTFMSKAASSLEEDEEVTCPVCLDEPPPGELAVAKCGHSFCKSCIERCVSEKRMCPTCRERLTMKELFVVAAASSSSAAQVQPQDPAQERERLRRVHGAKLASLVCLIRDAAADARIILFSEWSEQLEHAGNVLRKEKISNAYCRGSVDARNSAISRFRSGEVRVLMLSLMYCAAGIDLSCGTDVVFLAPVAGSLQSVQDIERQAIGRIARIGEVGRKMRIHRLVTLNTVEQEIYNRHHDDGLGLEAAAGGAAAAAR
jgi:SNF2 family DNA or RNA helicase